MTAHREEIVEAVRRMKGEGVRNNEIAMAVGVTEDTIKNMCHRRGIRKPTSGRLDLPLGAKLLAALHAESDRRGVPFPRFMRGMLSVIARDRLFSAIFDDGK